MSVLKKVHWQEGLLLLPHHFQADFRRVDNELATAGLHAHAYGWGLLGLEVNEEQLRSNYTFELRTCRLRLADGLLMDIPGNATAPARSFREIIARVRGAVEVFLGVPCFVEGRPNVFSEEYRGVPGQAPPRYYVRTENIPDENDGSNVQPLDVRYYNARLFFSNEDTGGYDVVKIAEVVLHPQEGTPIISQEYVPPLLSLDAGPWLKHEIQELFFLLSAKNHVLTSLVSQNRGALDFKSQEALTNFLKARATLGSTLELERLLAAPNLHPYTVYLALLRLAGEVMLFHPAGLGAFRPPPYRHDDLRSSFFKLMNAIRTALDKLIVVSHVALPFGYDAEEKLFFCQLKKQHLQKKCRYFLCVVGNQHHSEFAEDAERIQLSSRSFYQHRKERRVRGLKKARASRLPSTFPQEERMLYYEVFTTPQGTLRNDGVDLWAEVVASGELVISDAAHQRLNFVLYVLFPSEE
jgi:type VI secretion system protein ImpJ